MSFGVGRFLGRWRERWTLGLQAENSGGKLVVLEFYFLRAQGNSLGSEPGAGVLLFQGRPGEEDVADVAQAVGGCGGVRASEVGDGGPEFGFAVFKLLAE